MSSPPAIFFLLCCSLSSLHSCNGRILHCPDFDHEQSFGPKSLMISKESELQESEAASSLKTLSTITEEHPVRHGGGRSHEIAEKERRLQELNGAAEGHGSNEFYDVAEDAVVMDYTQPRRKPPIHNQEN